MDDLIKWLKAQIDDDEQAARKAGASSWSVGVEETSDGENAYYYSIGAHGEEPFVDTDVTERGKFDHIVRWDPARVLREVEAKRWIITVCSGTLGALTNPGAMGDADEVLRFLALPFSDRPGYREEWKP